MLVFMAKNLCGSIYAQERDMEADLKVKRRLKIILEKPIMIADPGVVGKGRNLVKYQLSLYNRTCTQHPPSLTFQRTPLQVFATRKRQKEDSLVR